MGIWRITCNVAKDCFHSKLFLVMISPLGSSSIRSYACEHETLHLECNEGEWISIQSANYGRLSTAVCNDNTVNIGTSPCRSDTAINIVRKTCDNHRSCDIPATNGIFGDPCSSIFKYLEVEYSCKGETRITILLIYRLFQLFGLK